MKRSALTIFVLLLCLSLIPRSLAQPTEYDKYLTVADIQKVTGLTGIKQVPRDPQKGAGGHLNFADDKGNMILLASFLTAEEFDFYKSEEGLVKEEMPGKAAFHGQSPLSRQDCPQPALTQNDRIRTPYSVEPSILFVCLINLSYSSSG